MPVPIRELENILHSDKFDNANLDDVDEHAVEGLTLNIHAHHYHHSNIYCSYTVIYGLF